MVDDTSLLIALVQLVDRLPVPPPPPAGRGRPRVYSDRLFLKALVIMIARHLATVGASVWIPLAGELTPANAADTEEASVLIRDLPLEVRYVLGDVSYNNPELCQLCAERGQVLVTTRRGAYPHTDGGVEVRRVFHKLRSLAIENLNEHVKAIFGVHGSVPTKALRNTQRFALGAIFVHQLALLYRFEHGLDLNVGLKPFLQAA